MKTTIESLIRRGHTRWTLAENRAGDKVLPRSPEAIAWCLIGAKLAAYDEPQCTQAYEAMRKFAVAHGFECVTDLDSSASMNLILQCARVGDRAVKESEKK